MRNHYAHDADALYIRLKEDDIDNSDQISDDIIIDFDKDNNIIGIEILSASQKADIIQTYDKVTVENSV